MLDRPPRVRPLTRRNHSPAADTMAPDTAYGSELEGAELGLGMPGNMSMMQMVFYFGDHFNLLFKQLRITSPGGLVGAIIVVMVVAVLYEGLKSLRELLVLHEVKKTFVQCGPQHDLQSDEQEPLLLGADAGQQAMRPRARPDGGGSKVLTVLREYCHWVHLLQSVLHVVQVGVGYLLMLVAMTFNGWLFLAVCFGAGIGYFLFAKSRRLLSIHGGPVREAQDHCH